MRRIIVVGAAVLAVGTLGACSGSGGGPSSAGGRLAAGRPAVASPAAASGATSASTHTGVDAALSNGARIRTADLRVSVRGAQNVAAQADAADDIATRAGGEIDADDRTTGKYATATLRLRVPPEALQAVLGSLAKLGKEQSRHLSSRDVTEQVADVSSRVASARQAITRLRGLYGHAQKVSDVISIEGELSSREADLESLQAQQRTLSRETAMASVTVYLRTLTAVPHHKKKPTQHGFVGGLSRGWHAFLAAGGAVATAAGAVLPFLLLVLLLAIAVRRGWPLLRRRSAPAPHPAPGPSE